MLFACASVVLSLKGPKCGMGGVGCAWLVSWGHKWEQEGRRRQRTKERGAQSFLSLPLGQIFVGQAVATKNEECLESDVTRWVGWGRGRC